MSLRCETSSLIAGALVCGDRGLGVVAENIDPGGFLGNDVSLPADNGKEIRGLITSLPAAGTLTAEEDGSFTFLGAPDGTYTFDYTLYVDGVSSGSRT